MQLLGGFKGVVNWISQKLFGKTLFTSATNAGTTTGGLFSKALYTGMSGQTVTAGKLLGGITLAAGGTALALTQATSAGANWEDLTTGTKLAKVRYGGIR